jgi:hypothetical protein
MATTITLSEETKEEFDKQRTLPQGQVTADEFLSYLLAQNAKKK